MPTDPATSSDGDNPPPGLVGRIWGSPWSWVITGAVLFGFCNIARRLGEGSIPAMAATRAVLGLILFAPMVIHVLRTGQLRDVVRGWSGIIACLLAGASLWASALLFRSVPGPLAAAVLGISPVVSLLIVLALRSQTMSARTGLAVLGCSAFGLVAAGPGMFTTQALIPAGVFLASDVAQAWSNEWARGKHDAKTLTVGGLLVGAAPAPFLWMGGAMATSGFVASVVVALLGTSGRYLKSHALGSIGVTEVASSSQVTALVTAVGGALVFHDELGPLRFAALLIASGLAVCALRWAVPKGTPALA